MKPPDDKLVHFLEGVREFREPSEEDTRRVGAALERRLPPGAFSERTISSRARARRPVTTLARAAGVFGMLTPLAAAAKLGTVKLVVGALIVTGAATGVTWVLLEHQSDSVEGSPQPTGGAAVSPRNNPAEPARTPSLVSPAPVASVKAAATPSAPPASPAPSGSAEPEAAGSSLSEEVGLLRRAEHLRKSGDPAGCLVLLSEMAHRFPTSSLTEERLVLTVLARCDLGQVQAATTAADSLKRRYPGTVHAERLRASCVSPTPRFEGEP